MRSEYAANIALQTAPRIGASKPARKPARKPEPMARPGFWVCLAVSLFAIASGAV